MTILDVDIEDVHRTVQWTASVQKIIHDSIPASFLACDDDVHNTTFRADVCLLYTSPSPRD